jgi:hypothetical protein
VLVDPLAPTGVEELVLEHHDGQILADYAHGAHGLVTDDAGAGPRRRSLVGVRRGAR